MTGRRGQAGLLSPALAHTQLASGPVSNNLFHKHPPHHRKQQLKMGSPHGLRCPPASGSSTFSCSLRSWVEASGQQRWTAGFLSSLRAQPRMGCHPPAGEAWHRVQCLALHPETGCGRGQTGRGGTSPGCWESGLPAFSCFYKGDQEPHCPTHSKKLQQTRFLFPATSGCTQTHKHKPTTC